MVCLRYKWVGGVFMLKCEKFSMYDIMLKGANKFQGKIMGILNEGNDKTPPVGIHYLSDDFLRDNWHIDIDSQHFSNYKATESQRSRMWFGDELVFGEKFFSGKWWVESILQYELGYEYKGFEEKKDAYAYYKEKKKDMTYFDVLIFKMTSSDLYDFIPLWYTYPVKEIADKKYYNHIRRSKVKTPFLYWFCQYLHTLMYHEFKRSGEDDCDFWWGLLKDLEEVEKEIKENKRQWYFHLYEMLDITLRHLYDGGNTDISNYK